MIVSRRRKLAQPVLVFAIALIGVSAIMCDCAAHGNAIGAHAIARDDGNTALNAPNDAFAEGIARATPSPGPKDRAVDRSAGAFARRPADVPAKANNAAALAPANPHDGVRVLSPLLNPDAWDHPPGSMNSQADAPGKNAGRLRPLNATVSPIPATDSWNYRTRERASPSDFRGAPATGYPSNLPKRAAIDLGTSVAAETAFPNAYQRCRYHQSRYSPEPAPVAEPRRFQCGVDPDALSTLASTSIDSVQVTLGFNRTLVFSYEW